MCDADGNEHVVSAYSAEQFLDETRSAFISAPGTQRLVALSAPTENAPTWWQQTFPIIGWRITGSSTSPIIPGEDCQTFGDRWICLVEMPDGKFLEAVYEGSFFDTIEAAKTELLRPIEDDGGKAQGKNSLMLDFTRPRAMYHS